MSHERIIELAQKLKALSERGVGGERENAIDKLDRLMQRHKITFDDLETETRHLRTFRFRNRYDRDILIQIMFKVLNVRSMRISHDRGTRGMRKIQVTDAEYLEITAMHEFYWKAFKREMKIFVDAFIQKNRLFPDSAGPGKDISELSPREWDRLVKMSGMMEGMETYVPPTRGLHENN